jgi:hypothetical protein
VLNKDTAAHGFLTHGSIKSRSFSFNGRWIWRVAVMVEALDYH